jgi:hypothetical protein
VTTMAGIRHRPLTWVVLTVAALVAALLPYAPEAALADGGVEAEFVAATNRERAAAGLPALSVASDLVAVARRHSVRMADQSHLHHNPNLAGEVSGWQKVGENVGRGPSVSSIQTAFMNSPGHRRNILDADWTQVGIGVEVRDTTIWVTVVFRLPSGATAAPAPAPAPSPSPSATAAPKPAATAAAAAAPAPAPVPASDGPAASEPTAAPEGPAEAPAAAEEPEPHEVVDTPLPLDRLVVTLARLDTADEQVRLEDVLATD